jgi:hypothetical protein
MIYLHIKCYIPRHKQQTVNYNDIILYFPCAINTQIAPKENQKLYLNVQITVATRSKAWACSRSPAETAVSNPAVSICCECCVLSRRGLCDGLIIRSGELYRLWRVWMWSLRLGRKEGLAHWVYWAVGRRGLGMSCTHYEKHETQLLYHTKTKPYTRVTIFFSVAQKPNSGLGRLLRYLDHKQLDTHTPGRTPLDERSARRRSRYLHNTDQYKARTATPSVWFEPATPATKRTQTYALDRTDTGTDLAPYYVLRSSIKQLIQNTLHVSIFALIIRHANRRYLAPNYSQLVTRFLGLSDVFLVRIS